MSSANHNIVPSEVGWEFVPQYYTFVNKHPNRLHCFYTKQSTFIHGTEGEDGKPCYGQHEIHNKITQLGFHDCKVFINSVDAQSSAAGGIIIQVIGEMSNRGDDWRKFVQTFFLAEQPNGYFVLNDIFRFLKEDAPEVPDTDQPSGDPVGPAHTGEAVPPPPPQQQPVAPKSPAPAPEPQPAPAPAASVEPPAGPSAEPPAPEEPPTTALPEPVAPTPPAPAADLPPQPNGYHHLDDAEPAPAPPAPTSPAPPVRDATPSPAPAPQPVAAPPPEPAPSPAPVTTPAAAAAAAAAPPAPPQAKTWAHLAAANSKKWGSAVAQESRGHTEVPAPAQQAPPGAPQPAGGAQAPAGPGGAQGPGPGARNGHAQREYPQMQAAMAITTPQCFVKGITEPLSDAALTAYLTARFGPFRDLQVVRARACAFLEFDALDAARRAVAASLPQGAGGEGGLRVPVGRDGGGEYVRVVVETRKERGERAPGGAAPRGRGAYHAQPQGHQQGGPGGYRGRGGPQQAGRGRGQAGQGTQGVKA